MRGLGYGGSVGRLFERYPLPLLSLYLFLHLYKHYVANNTLGHSGGGEDHCVEPLCREALTAPRSESNSRSDTLL